MPEPKKAETPDNVVDLDKARKEAHDEGRKAAEDAEKARREAITELGAIANLEAGEVLAFIEAGKSVEDVRKIILEKRAKEDEEEVTSGAHANGRQPENQPKLDYAKIYRDRGEMP